MFQGATSISTKLKMINITERSGLPYSVVGTTYELGSETTALDTRTMKQSRFLCDPFGEASAVIFQGEGLKDRKPGMTSQGAEEQLVSARRSTSGEHSRG